MEELSEIRLCVRHLRKMEVYMALGAVFLFGPPENDCDICSGKVSFSQAKRWAKQKFYVGMVVNETS